MRHQRGQGIRRSGRVESGQNTYNSTVRAENTQNNTGNRCTDRYQGNKKSIHDDKTLARIQSVSDKCEPFTLPAFDARLY